MAGIIRIANENFELEVDPSRGRITRYAPVNGGNVLWENPEARRCATPFPGWLNWGGDKVWLWPEKDWTVWNAGEKRPPGDPAGERYEVEVEGLGVVMTSPVIANYEVVVRREIRMAAEGSRVRIVNRVTRVGAGARRLPVGAWVVTQIPAPVQAYARLVKGGGYEGFVESPWRDVKVGGVDGDVVTLTRPGTPWMKIGLDADVLAAPVGEYLFVTRMAGHGAGEFEPRRRAQVFSDPDDSPFRVAGLGAYIELEYTSPVRVLEAGESVEVVLEWELVKNFQFSISNFQSMF